MQGPILGVPRTAGRDSGLSLARRARARGPSTSASMSRHHLAQVPQFSASVDQRRLFLTCPAISCEFHKPSVEAPAARNRHRARPFGGQCHPTKRWRSGLVNPDASPSPPTGADGGESAGGEKLRAIPWISGWTNPIFVVLFRLVTSLRFAIPAASADRQSRRRPWEKTKN